MLTLRPRARCHLPMTLVLSRPCALTKVSLCLWTGRRVGPQTPPSGWLPRFRGGRVTRGHILVVEDDRDIRESVTEILEEQGYGVSVAGDGAQALHILAAEPRKPDLILLDLMMPNMNGFQFREEQLKSEAHSKIPVAVLTADGGAREKAAKLKVDAFVKKPLGIRPLLELVERLLAGNT
jgi:CheY-like chemotaxis protein